jgi:hypothetical protein
MQKPIEQNTKPLLLCVALGAMLLGMVIAWSQLASGWSGRLPDTVVARVADQDILKAELQLAIDAANSSRREPITAAQERQVLQRLVDEQLLLQYGVNLGLVRDDPTVRKPLVQAVMSLLRANAAAEAPNESVLREWYAANAAQFAASEQRHLRLYRLAQGQLTRQQLQVNAQALAAALREYGQLTAEQSQQWQVQRQTYLPDRPLPVNKLRDYLGQSLVSAALAKQSPEVLVLEPFDSGLAVLHVVAAVRGEVADFEQVREQVTRAWQRQQGEQALRLLLANLRDEYSVQITESWR